MEQFNAMPANLKTKKQQTTATKLLNLIDQLNDSELDALNDHFDMVMTRHAVNEARASGQPIYLTEEERRQHRCAITGHRGGLEKRAEGEVKIALGKAIRTAIESGYTTFITGGTWPSDLWAAETVIQQRNYSPGIRLMILCPYKGCERAWSNEIQEQYRAMLLRADVVRYVSEKYEDGVYAKRNQWMTDHSGLLIAATTGKPSGTMNTVEYARSIGVKTLMI